MRKYRGELIYQWRGPGGPVEVVDDLTTRSLHFGNDTRQSSMWLHHPALLVLAYTRAMLSALLFVEQPRQVLLVGLGGGSLVRFLRHHYPDCRIDSLEPRAEVIHVARHYFELPADPRHQVFLRDGMGFLRQSAGTGPSYDLVLVDAFDAHGVVTEVASEGFLSAVHARLARHGVLAVNLARPQRETYRAALRALRQRFPRRTLRLPVAGKGNEIVLAFRDAPPGLPVRELELRARALQERLGLDLPGLLRVLRRDNPGLWARSSG